MIQGMQYEDARSDIRRSAAIIILEQQALLARILNEVGLSKNVLLTTTEMSGAALCSFDLKNPVRAKGSETKMLRKAAKRTEP